MIDDYVRSLASQLRGPWRLKADLVAEARDGLEDAALAYQERGLDRPAAQARAILEFGDVRQVAVAYQVELAVGQARRLAVAMMLLPVAVLVAHAGWWQPLDAAPDVVPAAFAPVGRLLGWGSSCAAGTLAVTALVGLARSARRSDHDPRTLVRVVALGALAIVGALWSAGTVAAGAAALADPAAVAWPALAAAWGSVTAVSAVLAGTAARCVLCARQSVAAG